ncbi:MAG: ribosome biogenesis GTPase Der [Rhodobiaceae bacterium]|nr:ribosome biogenesis GTPase Der [Rhodobiaceae bacterium]
MPETLAIIGRPNVGKSTLFNRLIGKRLALVANEPGITRDYRTEKLNIENNSYKLIDTAGIEEISRDNISRITKDSSISAINKSDIILFVIDARNSLTPDDYSLASIVRKSGKKVILIANKSEGRSVKQGEVESHSLGFGNPLSISSEHNLGISELHNQIIKNSSINIEFENEESNIKKIAILGRPNSGKSTLINQLIGENRQIVGPEAGLTRDSIPLFFNWNSINYQIWDTAGIRKKSKVLDYAEKLSVMSSLNATEESEIIILMIDSERGFEKQDANIANIIESEGKPFVIAVNKWDLIDNKKEKKKEIEKKIEEFLPQFGKISIAFISAQKNQGIEKLMQLSDRLDKICDKRLTTSELNEFLIQISNRHPHPNKNGRSVKIKYITQPKVRPSHFIIFSNYPNYIKESYKRYLVNEIRKEFDFNGVPIKIDFRGSDNPYESKK